MALYYDECLADNPKVLFKFNEASGNPVNYGANTLTGFTGSFGRSTGLEGLAASTGSMSWSGGITLGTADPYTVEFWFKTTTTALQEFFIASGSGFTQLRIFMLAGGTMRILSTTANDTTSAAYNDGLWHHCLVTRPASGSMIMYIDGVNRASTSRHSSTSSTFTVSAGENMEGFAQYQTALSSTRAAAHAAGTFATPAVPFMGWGIPPK